jgi:NitT/TauT family transport system ATP-binding protein
VIAVPDIGAATPPIVEALAVSKSFATPTGLQLAVAESTFQIRKGEFISIIGPSGCGKTTILQMIAGFIAPTSGNVLYEGSPVRQPGPERMVVFQEYGLFPWMTVAENIGFGLEARGVPRAQRQEDVAKYVDLIRLQGFEHRYPHQISGGMKQRVGIARALVLQPHIVLMDEPFGALDSLTRDLLQEEILRIQQITNQTLLLITHNIDEAVLLSDRVFVMSARPGRLETAIDIALPRPRSASLRVRDPSFARYREQLTDLLHGIHTALEEEAHHG